MTQASLSDEIARIPAATPRDADLLPGLKLSNNVSRTMLVLPALVLLVLFLAPLAILIFSPEAKLALRATHTVQGRIDKVEPASRCPRGIELDYSFETPDGVTWRGSDRLCKPGPYADARAGDSIAVTYVETDPTISAIPRGFRDPAKGLAPLLVIPILGALFLIPFFWPGMAQVRRDRKLFRTGTLALGRVIYVKTRSDAQWHGTAPLLGQARVFVHVRLDTGEEREVSAICTNQWLLSHLPPGAEVHVCVSGDRAMLVENYLR